MTDRPATGSPVLTRARDIGHQAGLRHVYIGNIHGGGGENTACPACSCTVIHRHGFSVRGNLLERGRCPQCAAEISGVW
jgi:pyruvate formate lyase activating enzyme